MMVERREFQRLHLTRPLDGWFGDYAVRLLDVSANGALIEIADEIPTGARALLRFFWRDAEVEIMAETIRHDDGRSGLAFIDRSDVLMSLIAQSAAEVLYAQEANAMGLRDHNVIGHDETLTAASAGRHGLIQGYVTLRLMEDGTWKKAAALLPDQPEDGFTVAAAESNEQIELLCRNYESGDAEARRMIRMLAELSVAKKR